MGKEQTELHQLLIELRSMIGATAAFAVAALFFTLQEADSPVLVGWTSPQFLFTISFPSCVLAYILAIFLLRTPSIPAVASWAIDMAAMIGFSSSALGFYWMLNSYDETLGTIFFWGFNLCAIALVVVLWVINPKKRESGISSADQ